MARTWVQSFSESCQTLTWSQVRTPNPTTRHMATPAIGEVVSVPVFDLPKENNRPAPAKIAHRSEEHTSELQSLAYLVCRLLLEKKKMASPAAKRLLLSCTSSCSKQL